MYALGKLTTCVPTCLNNNQCFQIQKIGWWSNTIRYFFLHHYNRIYINVHQCRFKITNQVIKAYPLKVDMQTYSKNLYYPLSFQMFTKPWPWFKIPIIISRNVSIVALPIICYSKINIYFFISYTPEKLHILHCIFP